MTYGYVRVSTREQNENGQKLAIVRYLKAKGKDTKDITWVIEKVSGTKKPSERKLGTLMKKTDDGDRIIITELSRFGRSLMMVLDTLQTFLEKKVAVTAIKEGYELGDNVQSKVLAFAFGLSAEIERNLISERTKYGLERAKAEGKHIGRRKGQKPSVYKLTGKEGYIVESLRAGKSKRSISIKLHVHYATLDRFIKESGMKLRKRKYGGWAVLSGTPDFSGAGDGDSAVSDGLPDGKAMEPVATSDGVASESVSADASKPISVI